MSKFRVMVVKKNGQPVGVRAAAINGRVIVLALRDDPNKMNWHDAVNAALVRAGGAPLEKIWYWSSSESDYGWAWSLSLGRSHGLGHSCEDNPGYTRPVLAF